jgi:DUF917 family protein
MGGMGLASQPKISIHQVGMGGLDEDGSQLIVTAEGNIVRTSNVMRQAAVVNGGLIYAARGPLSAAFVKANGAPGAISFQLDLGRAMLDSNGTERIPATVAFLKGEHLMTGKVTENTVTYSGGFDLGYMTVTDGQRQVRLGVYNEYMTADVDGARVATFPDMIGTLDPGAPSPSQFPSFRSGRMLRSSSPIEANSPSDKARGIPPCSPRWRMRWASICVHISKGLKSCFGFTTAVSPAMPGKFAFC